MNGDRRSPARHAVRVRHGLVRDVAYGQIPRASRAEKHVVQPSGSRRSAGPRTTPRCGRTTSVSALETARASGRDPLELAGGSPGPCGTPATARSRCTRPSLPRGFYDRALTLMAVDDRRGRASSSAAATARFDATFDNLDELTSAHDLRLRPATARRPPARRSLIANYALEPRQPGRGHQGAARARGRAGRGPAGFAVQGGRPRRAIALPHARRTASTLPVGSPRRRSSWPTSSTWTKRATSSTTSARRRSPSATSGIADLERKHPRSPSAQLRRGRAGRTTTSPIRLYRAGRPPALNAAVTERMQAASERFRRRLGQLGGRPARARSVPGRATGTRPPRSWRRCWPAWLPAPAITSRRPGRDTRRAHQISLAATPTEPRRTPWSHSSAPR